MNISRRFFIGGAASFGALAGCRAFNAPVGKFGIGPARLKFGVVSDIHVAEGEGDFKKFGDNRNFVGALEYFRAQGVDGVVVAGDMADNGMINQLKKVAEAWYEVFPDDRDRNGRKVEKLFVYGNHDLEGFCYDGYAERFHERTSFEAARIVVDPARAWEEAFHEPYAPIWSKEVNGYRFIGAHWVAGRWDGIEAVEPYMAGNGGGIDPKLPFFFIQHPHPMDTCHLGHAWGQDKGYARRALNPFPNAVAFSGHSHTPLTDESAIWQGEFTSVGTASLRYGGGGFADPAPCGYENGRTPKVDGVDRDAADAAKVMGDEVSPSRKWNARQGMLVSVYDDRIVFHRRDFINREALGDDWVMPLPAAESRPFAPEANKVRTTPPRFAAGAKLKLSVGKRKPRKGEPVDAVVFEFPAAWAEPGVRPFDYELVCEQDGKEVFKRYLSDKGFSYARHRAERLVHAAVPKSAFPAGRCTVRVVPRNVNYVKGEPLSAEFS